MLSSRKVAVALALLFALHVAVFGWRSLVAERNLESGDPDALNYITVARNLSEGKGFVQSAPGFNQPGLWDEQFSPDFPPETRHSHSVAYPLAIFAFAEITRLPHATAALLLSVLAYAASIALVFIVSRQLWGTAAALLAAAVFPFELRNLFLRAWTETLAVPTMLATFALLIGNPSAAKTAAAGLLSGFAVLIRTGMIPLPVVGALACAFRREKAGRCLAIFAAAAAVPLFGKFIGEGIRYSTYTKLKLMSLSESLAGFAREAADEFAILAALSALALWRRWKSQGAVFPLNWRGGEAALWMWLAIYFAFLVVGAMNFYFGSPANSSRYRDPMEAVMVALYAGLAARVCAGHRNLPTVAAALFAISMTVGIIRDAKVLVEVRDVSDAARIENSALLRWVRDNVRRDDFVLGDDAESLPYYFPERVPNAVAFDQFPLVVHLSESKVDAVVRARCGKFGRAFMILRPDKSERYGDFIGGLTKKEPAQNYALLADLEDGVVYEMTHCAAPVGG